MKMHSWGGAGLCLLGSLCVLMACGEAPPESHTSFLATVEQASSSPGGTTRWARQSLGSEFESAHAVAVDREGYTFLAGSYSGGPADFGGGPLPAPIGTEGTRAFLARYAPDGSHLWSRSFGSSFVTGPTGPFTQLSAIAVDRKGHLTVLGRGSLGTDLGGGPMPAGVYLARYTSDGSFLWARVFRGGFGFGGSLATDPDGNILLVGSIHGTVDLGGGSRTSLAEAAFIARYEASGAWLWDRVFVTPGSSHFHDVTTDRHGNVYVSGFFVGEASFGGVTFTVPSGLEGPVVAKYRPSGEHLWSASLGSMTGGAEFRGIAVQGTRVLVTGQFSGDFAFNSDTFSSSDGPRGLLLAYHRDGEEAGGTVLGASGMDVQFDARGNALVLGFARPGENIGSGPLPVGASRYLFVTKLDRIRGTPHWARAFSADGILQVSNLAASRHGEAIVSGVLTGPTDFGTGLLTPEKTSAFLLRLRR